MEHLIALTREVYALDPGRLRQRVRRMLGHMALTQFNAVWAFAEWTQATPRLRIPRPYFYHPPHVVLLARQEGEPGLEPDDLEAIWLHDTVEEGQKQNKTWPFLLDEVDRLAGPYVRERVGLLTNPPGLICGQKLAEFMALPYRELQYIRLLDGGSSLLGDLATGMLPGTALGYRSAQRLGHQLAWVLAHDPALIKASPVLMAMVAFYQQHGVMPHLAAASALSNRAA